MDDGFRTLAQRADDELDPFQGRLYMRFSRMCAESEDGTCRMSTKELAEACRMSTGQVVKSRRELVEMGFISLVPGVGTRASAVTMHSEQSAPTVHGVNASMSPGERKTATVHPMNTERSPHEHNDPSVHTVNTSPSHERAVTGTLEDLKHLETKDKNLKDKTKEQDAPAHEAVPTAHPITNDTAAMMQGDVLMRAYETACKAAGAPQTLNHQDGRLRKIAAQYYRDGYTAEEVEAAVKAGFADGKLIPFPFLGEKMGALRVPRAASRASPRASPAKPQAPALAPTSAGVPNLRER